ncbi:glycoside hydrolase family 30 protein [Dichotomopilus funicola]|uniref:glucan endo-1,6-beta-glucosidase n=1 Tax=Dichotomopilus funicola TaxID=1934379 RepID=A0AAN6UXP6_9PEZI|nr:glycoside hydrolase family 30 protein [Dichotomopilus funicola]
MLSSTLAILAAAPTVWAAATLRARASPQAFASSSDGSHKLSEIDAPVSGTGDAGGASTWKLSVKDQSGKKQTITGFGATVTDATVTVFNSLSSDKLSDLLNELVTPAGANFQLLRHTIASSDLSADPAYSYDDNGGKADTDFKSFGLGDRGTAMAQMLKKLKGLQSDLTILGTPWSPPGWMKLNGVLMGNTQNNNLDPNHAGDFGKYLAKYLDAYKSEGVDIDAITIQNEPLNSRPGMPTMYVFADESGKLIQNNVGPALRDAGHKTTVWAYDHNTDKPEYPQTVLDEASEFVNAVAWHCYASSLDWGVLTDFHNKNPNVDQYMTECWTSSQTGWSQAADFTMGPLQNWARGAMAWTLGSDKNFGPHLSANDGPCTTCRGLVTVDTATGNYNFEVDYYMMAQFSKFMPKGAVVLDGTGSYSYGDGTGIQSVASVNPDGSKTVVIENKFSNDVYVTVSLESGAQWSGSVLGNAVVTWVLPA